VQSGLTLGLPEDKGAAPSWWVMRRGVPSETRFSRTLTLTPNPNPNLFGMHTERRGSECVVDYKVVCSRKTSEIDKL